MFVFLISLALTQEVVKIGGGSYASEPPKAVWDEDFYGTSYRTLSEKWDDDFHIIDSARTKPIPTNHWFTNYFFSQWGGYAWSWPQGVRSENANGIDVLAVVGFDNEVMKIASLTLQHNGFNPNSSPVLDWSDIGFTFREEAGNAHVDTTSIHGVPFTYFELTGINNPTLHPQAAATFYDAAGAEVTFPAKIDALTVEFNNAVFGVHVPAGTTIDKNGQDLEFQFAGGATYIVVSDLPSRKFLAQYNGVARNKPTNTKFEYDYSAAQGQITTTFSFETKGLDGGAGGDVIVAFLPHQWRTTTQNFKFIDGASYRTLHGNMKVGEPAQSYTLTYEFSGFPPYLPKPLELTDAQLNNLKSLIKHNADDSGGMDGNTYAKGLGEKTSIMLEAFGLGITEDADKIKNNLIKQYSDWFNYNTTEEKEHYFAMYPQYGALIGWPSGYGSQGFNDLHFHYGYFVVGAARLMLLDNDFRDQYGPFVKFLVADFANWKHYDPSKPKGVDNPYFPFLRNFDAYEGHSYAGGTGDDGGNNQESTSEALNSWWGIYVLGIALNDPEILKLGAVGYKLEVLAAGEYWLDLHGDVLPEEYPHDFVGVLRSGQIAFGTYFSGDAGWVLGIQGVPCDFYYQPHGDVPENMKRVWESMLKERGGGDGYANINDMGAYLGGYHLNLLATYDPETAVAYIDKLYSQGGEWTTHVNIATIFYIAHAYITYGRPAKGYHTSLASGAVYQNSKGELTYLIYNPGNAAADVQIYQNGVVVDTVNVGARQLYNSKQK